ncbi:response regulator transcription factor [Actinospica robiniae]|uniref:response regulator transcription factor n=1 Tax=Actinospica robiniae TaxID=304901 RepID=UPI0004023AFD|nr:response regulator transcription factor [Actinospica robiniae]
MDVLRPIRGDGGRDVTVVVCASRPLTRAGLRAALNETAGVTVVGDAETPMQLERLLREQAPQVVVVDDEGCESDGIELVRRLAERSGGRIAVVVLTELELGERVLEYLRVGARALVLGDGSLGEIAQAVVAVASGHALIAPPLAAVLVDLMLRRIPAAAYGAGLSSLTPREQETLGLIASGLSNQEIAKTLFLSEKTVKFHVSNLLGKLGLRNRSQAIVYARDSGVPLPG